LYTKAATIPYWIMSVIFSGYIFVVLFLTDEITYGNFIFAAFFALTIAILITWNIILPKLRIEIDYEKKELFYWNDYYRRRIKFEDIRALEIVEHREKVTFGCKITTDTKIRRFGYTRYYRKKPTPEILAKVEEVKEALRSIPISKQ
jgi:hypothetical protein